MPPHDTIFEARGCGGTAYAADLKSAGETLGVRISSSAPIKAPVTLEIPEYRSFLLFFNSPNYPNGFPTTKRRNPYGQNEDAKQCIAGREHYCF
jgi:hypothetical protein